MAATKAHAIVPQIDPVTLQPIGDAEAGRHRRGEVVDVFDADARGMVGPHPNPWFHRIYVPDWPGTLDEAREALVQPHMTSSVLSPDSFIARSRLVFDDFDAAEAVALERDRQITIAQANLLSRSRARLPGTRDLPTRTRG